MSDPAVPQTIAALIVGVVQRVAELPDRASPDEWPDAMLVTAAELTEILEEALAALPVLVERTQTCPWCGTYEAIVGEWCTACNGRLPAAPGGSTETPGQEPG